MTIILDIDVDIFIEENNDQRERLLALLRDSIESTIRTNFKADSLNGLELYIDDDHPDDGACDPCPHCDELTDYHKRRCEHCGEPRY